MPKLIPGNKLSPAQRERVLNAYIYRNTFENARKNWDGDCPMCVLARRTEPKADIEDYHNKHSPLISDDAWLKAHGFWFVNDGSRLSGTHKFAEVLS